MLSSPFQLNEFPITSAQYNSLPYVNDSHNSAMAPDGEEAKVALLKLIADHGLDDIFSLHLLHKHFDVAESKVMVYTTVSSPQHPPFEILSPRKLETVSSLNGKYFYTTSDGNMRAYEYTADAQPDIYQYTNFVSIFSQAIVKLGMQRVFALGVRPVSGLRDCSEVEIDFYQATVFIEDLDLPDSFQTDWTNADDATKTIVNQKYQWKDNQCSSPTDRLRSSNVVGMPQPIAWGPRKRCRIKKKGHTSLSYSCQGKAWCLDGMILAQDSQTFLALSSAMELLALQT